MKIYNINSNDWFEKIGNYGKKAGRIATRPALLLYFVLKSPNTPVKDKRLILLAFTYLLLPLDLIPFSRFPLLGLTDEGFSIWVIYNKVSRHITPDIERKVDRILMNWFSEFSYEILPNE